MASLSLSCNIEHGIALVTQFMSRIPPPKLSTSKPEYLGAHKNPGFAWVAKLIKFSISVGLRGKMCRYKNCKFPVSSFLIPFSPLWVCWLIFLLNRSSVAIMDKTL